MSNQSYYLYTKVLCPFSSCNSVFISRLSMPDETSHFDMIQKTIRVCIRSVFPVFLLLEFKTSTRQKPTSTWQDLTARTLHLFTLHTHSLNMLKVERCAFCCSCTHKHSLMTCYLGYFSVCCIILPGNTKRSISILQNAIELGAQPRELLEAALQSMQTGKTQLLCPEDKENAPREYLFMFYTPVFYG